MKTLQEATNAALAGLTVCWKQDNYQLCGGDHVATRGPTAWLVCCMDNQHCIGLYHSDGVTTDHNPEDFYIAGESKGGRRA